VRGGRPDIHCALLRRQAHCADAADTFEHVAPFMELRLALVLAEVLDPLLFSVAAPPVPPRGKRCVTPCRDVMTMACRPITGPTT